MNRCTPPFSPVRRRCAGALLAAGLACASLGVAAQGLPSGETRNFPPQAQFGELVVTSQFPVVEIDGKALRTTPGFRLFSPERTLVQAVNYQGSKLVVGYVIEPQTQWLHQAWILTQAEADKHYKPKSLLQRILN